MFLQLPHEAIAYDFHNHTAEYLTARADEDGLNVPSFLQQNLVQRHEASECWPTGHDTEQVNLGSESFYNGSVDCFVAGRQC